MTDIIAQPFHQFPAEGAAIGRMLVHYGELEWCLAHVLGAALDNGGLILALRTLYRIRSESSRIQLADALARFEYEQANLIDDYAYALGLIRHALKIRNQYSHCTWGGGEGQLRFLNLEDEATKPEGFWNPPSEWAPWQNLNAEILREQEAHFALTAQWLEFVAGRLQFAKGIEKNAKIAPPKRPLPKLYIPQIQSPGLLPDANPSAPQE